MHQPWSLGILILISPAIFFVCRLALSERKHVRVSQKRSWFWIRAVFAVSQSIFVDCISVSGDLGHTLCALPHLQGPLRILLNDVNTLNSIAAKHPISPLSLLLFGTYPLSVLACFSMASHALHARTSSAWVRPSCPLFCPVSRPSFPLPFPLCPPLSHTHMSPDKPSSPPLPIRPPSKRYRCSYGHRSLRHRRRHCRHTAAALLLTVFCACARMPPPLAHEEACCLMPAEAVSHLDDCICRQFVHSSRPSGGVCIAARLLHGLLYTAELCVRVLEAAVQSLLHKCCCIAVLLQC
ncbi:hypothetical protein HDV57DRAFT_430716 [Trichoderma longibrachiatum]